MDLPSVCPNMSLFCGAVRDGLGVKTIQSAPACHMRIRQACNQPTTLMWARMMPVPSAKAPPCPVPIPSHMQHRARLLATHNSVACSCKRVSRDLTTTSRSTREGPVGARAMKRAQASPRHQFLTRYDASTLSVRIRPGTALPHALRHHTARHTDPLPRA